MRVAEIPLVFDCQGAALVGIVHLPEEPTGRGVLAVVAGGPQYRGGCCRQLIYMARALAQGGVPVMRFDYRGMGDSSGPFQGFEHVEDDIGAALQAFRQTVPGMEEVILWGGCDAASAILIHAHRFPIVTGMILGNPFAHSEETRAAVERNYYLNRLRDKVFWKKVFTLRFNPLPAIRSVASAFGVKQNKLSGEKKSPGEAKVPFTMRMLDGLKRFRGRILLMMSAQSLISQEFDELIESSAGWRKALQAATVERVDIQDADQVFSTVEAREKTLVAARTWMSQFR